MTDANGTAIDLTQGVGKASDFHDKKFDKQTDTGAGGLNADWKISDRVELNLDGSFSRAREFPNGGAESELALLGYNGQTISYHSDGAILPYTTGFVKPTSGPECRCRGRHASAVPARHAVIAAMAFRRQHRPVARRPGHQGRRSEPGAGRFEESAATTRTTRRTRRSFRMTAARAARPAATTIPSPPGIPIGVFNAGGNFLSGVSGANRLHDPVAHLRRTVAVQRDHPRATGAPPGFTFAPPKVNDSFVQERVFGGYLEAVFAGSLLDRPFTTVVGVRVENTQETVSGLATQFIELTKLANDPTQYGVATGRHRHAIELEQLYGRSAYMSFKWKLMDDFIARFAASQTMTRPTLEQLSPVTTLVTLRPGNFAASSGNADLKPVPIQ